MLLGLFASVNRKKGNQMNSTNWSQLVQIGNIINCRSLYPSNGFSDCISEESLWVFYKVTKGLWIFFNQYAFGAHYPNWWKHTPWNVLVATPCWEEDSLLQATRGLLKRFSVQKKLDAPQKNGVQIVSGVLLCDIGYAEWNLIGYVLSPKFFHGLKLQ